MYGNPSSAPDLSDSWLGHKLRQASFLLDQSRAEPDEKMPKHNDLPLTLAEWTAANPDRANEISAIAAAQAAKYGPDFRPDWANEEDEEDDAGEDEHDLTTRLAPATETYRTDSTHPHAQNAVGFLGSLLSSAGQWVSDKAERLEAKRRSRQTCMSSTRLGLVSDSSAHTCA